MRGLAFRRHQVLRAKSRALRYLRRTWTLEPRTITAKLIGRRAENRVPCSCYMCGNPRHYRGEITLQEQRILCRCPEFGI